MSNGFDVDAVIAAIYRLESLLEIASKADAPVEALIAWIHADPIRKAQIQEARANAAAFWDEKAEWLLSAAQDEFGLQKAKELASHYRWRASKIAPRTYGDKQKIEVENKQVVYVVEGVTKQPAIDNWQQQVTAYLLGASDGNKSNS